MSYTKHFSSVFYTKTALCCIKKSIEKINRDEVVQICLYVGRILTDEVYCSKKCGPQLSQK